MLQNRKDLRDPGNFLFGTTDCSPGGGDVGLFYPKPEGSLIFKRAISAVHSKPYLKRYEKTRKKDQKRPPHQATSATSRSPPHSGPQYKPVRAISPFQQSLTPKNHYNVTEAACYFLLKNDDDDANLRQEVEQAVDMIRAAQHEDGYLNSYYTVRGISKRWTNVRDMHELYCPGHLVEACVAYEILTDSGRLLEPVMKALRHVDSVFGPEEGKLHGYPGHPEIELGLLRLYNLTKDPLPLKLAKYFILERCQKDENGEIFYDHEARAREGDPDDHMSTELPNPYHHPRYYE
ncbi:hypothetical protein TMatcc_000313 [Talaromyces marneffei ATCC 18224]